jgi:putative restriction endonuclease
MDRKRWERSELLRVLVLYCDIPFGQIHSRNPLIIKLSDEIGRTPSAVALKMVNFASLDPTISQKGMSNVSALDRSTWEMFFNDIDHFLTKDVENPELGCGFSDCPQTEFELSSSKEATEHKSSTIFRRGQDRFRRAVLASYNGRCAISGVDDPRLLVASHIAPWAANVGRRLDPRNGICLNALLDRAFDAGVFTLSANYDIIFSKLATPRSVEIILESGRSFRKPDRFAPDLMLLHEHAVRFGFEAAGVASGHQMKPG